MKLNYNTTIDEMVETQLLFLRETNIYRKWIIWGAVYWVLVAALIVFLSNGSIVGRVVGGLFIGALVGGPILLKYRSIIGGRIKKVLLQKLGGEASFPSTVEIEGNKVVYEAEGNSVSYLLQNMIKFELLDAGLLLSFSRGGILFIPNEAFPDQAVKNEWIKIFDELPAKII